MYELRQLGERPLMPSKLGHTHARKGHSLELAAFLALQIPFWALEWEFRSRFPLQCKPMDTWRSHLYGLDQRPGGPKRRCPGSGTP